MKECYDSKLQRWKGAYPGGTQTDPNTWEIIRTPQQESEIYDPIRSLLNRILHHMGVLGSRRVLDCSSKKVPSRHNQTTQPDLFLIQTPSGRDATTGENQSWRTWASCLSPIEAKPHHKAIKRAADEANHTLRKSDREQVASYAQEVFGAQDNRRFCYVLLITEEILRVHMFDHSGVIFHEFAYHVHPEKFCAVISGIAGPQDKARGFDTSLDLLEATRRILMPLSGTQYLAKTEIFRSYSLIGEGVVTWAAHAQSTGRDVIVKDSWEITPGFEQLVMQRALAQKVSKGIGRIIEFTSLPDDSAGLLSTSSILEIFWSPFETRLTYH
ncbi:hypothetical protein K439DRAFT_658125 [Ramaria rubella]|nr:hypothetical protein K439DRAFT_658125 [Ramaria rubella]